MNRTSKYRENLKLAKSAQKIFNAKVSRLRKSLEAMIKADDPDFLDEVATEIIMVDPKAARRFIHKAIEIREKQSGQQ